MGDSSQAIHKNPYLKFFRKMTFSSQDLVSFVLYFIFLTTVSIMDLSFQYISLIGVTFVFIGLMFLKGKWPKFNFVDIFALMPLLVWFYGFSIGVLNSNNSIGIVRNFAGMTFYLVYFFMVFSGISRRRIISILVKASVIYLLLAFSLGIHSAMTRELLVMNDINGTSSVRFYYSIGLYILIPTLFIYLSLSSQVLRLKSNKLSLVKKNHIIVFSIFVVIFFSGSKGIYLSLLAIAVVMGSVSICYSLKYLKINLYFFNVLVIGVFLVVYFQSDIGLIVQTLLSMEFDPSHPRVIQSKKLIEDFTVFGKGLGGVVPGYSRDEFGYGFELSFHNIIHKFGIMSLFVFVSFLAPIFYSIFHIIYKTSNLYSYLPLIFMLYLVPSWGNPTVFAPVCVLLHCTSLYFMRLGGSKRRGVVNLTT